MVFGQSRKPLKEGFIPFEMMHGVVKKMVKSDMSDPEHSSTFEELCMEQMLI